MGKKLEEEFKNLEEDGAENPETVARKKKEEILEFARNIPVIRHLCNKGLKSRHWEALTWRLQPDRDAKSDQYLSGTENTLKDLLDLGIAEHINFVSELSNKASKEFAHEQELDKMLQEWNHIVFEFKEQGDSSILQNVDPTIA